MFKGFKNKIIIPMLIVLISLFSAGCSAGSYKTKMSVENNTPKRMQMSYSSFEGYKYTSIKLKKGDELTLNVNVTTEKGNLKISVLDEDDTELFKTENPKEEITKTIKIDKDADYKIKVEGKHKGKYKITWDTKESE